MDKEELERLIEEGLSLNKIAKKYSKSQSTIRHWLKKYSLKTKRGPKGKHPKDFDTPRKCPCGETEPSKFYGHKKSICAKCHNDYNHKKGREKRLKALEYLGQKCKLCDFDKYSCSLDIHHLDSKEKDPAFNTMRYWSWKRLEKELKKCVLLCKNCHAAVHNGHIRIM